MRASHLLFFTKGIILIAPILQLTLTTTLVTSSSLESTTNKTSLRTSFLFNDFDKQHEEQPQSQHIAPHRHHNKRRTRKKYEKDLLIQTQSGYVRGRRFNLDRNFQDVVQSKRRRKYKLNAWLGIPYAEPPVGSLRFKRPVPVNAWSGVKNTTELPNSCYQTPDTIFPGFWGTELWNANTKLSEDCLYLNVWTNSPKPRNAPVVVWIYGGSYLSGTATLKIYDPRVIVGETELVFVSLNYRVSIFGFLYMNDMEAPGNQGLLDQNMALKWIYNNIQYFGGDASRITIFGESAGSASVSLHLLSPLSRDLFKSAIMQSGSSLADWVTLKSSIALDRYSGMLRELGCNGTNAEMVECARKVEPRHAIEKSDKFFFARADHGIMQFPFLPVIDNYFLTEEPSTSINTGNFKKCPILLGVNKDEANWFYIYSFAEYRNLSVRPELTYNSFKYFLKSLFHYYPQYPSVITDNALNAIIFKYTNWENVNNINRNLEALDNVAADFHFICPAIDLANSYAMNKLDVFFYHFTQRASSHLWPEWFGVLHADEISFLFGEPLYSELQNFTQEEKVLSRKLLKYWSNFVRYDDPNGPNELNTEQQGQVTLNNDGVLSHKINTDDTRRQTLTLRQEIEPWPKYELRNSFEDDDQRALLVLNAAKIETENNFRAGYCSFWGSYLPNLILNEVRVDKECPLIGPKRMSDSSVNGGVSRKSHSIYSLTCCICSVVFRNYFIY